MTLFWIYVVCQLISTAYGVTVINSARKIPALKKRLKQAGYTQRDKNSLYKFNDWLKYFFKGFIPFYYAYKAMQLVNSVDPVGELMQEEINNGNYISSADEAIFKDEEEKASMSLAYDPNVFKYEEVGPYKARKLDINEIYDEDETPIEYITREFEKDPSNKITPFVQTTNYEVDSFKEVDEEPKKYTIPEVVTIEDKKPSVSNSDIAEAISHLSEYELQELGNKILKLAENKKDNSIKDVA